MSRIFDLKLYREGIRYLKNFGVIATVILTAFPLFAIASEIFDSSDGVEIARRYVSAFTLNPILVLLFCVVAPLMTIMLFNFTTSRAASDFYFSVPKTRTTLYFSFFASIISWVGIILLFSVGVPMALSFVFYKFIAYNLLASLIFVVQLIISCVYIISACLIAISVTGTVFSNIAVALILIFAPRIFITVLVNCGMDGLHYASATETFSLLRFDVNLPVGFVLNAFGGGMFSFGEGVTPIIYTSVIGIAYLLIGALLFNRRNSEAASKAAATEKLRAIFRISLGTAIGLGAAATFFTTWGARHNSNIALDDFSTWFAIIAIFAVAFAAYCCYDLLMTKNLKLMVKSMPTFLIVLAIDIAAVGAMFSIQYAVESYQPTPEEISGVYLYYSDYDNEYFGTVTSDIKIKDATVNRIISAALKDNIEHTKKGREFGADYYDYYSEHDEIRVYIESGGIKHFRNLMLPYSDSEKIVAALNQNAEFKKAFTHLPDPKKNKVSVYTDSVFNLTYEQKVQLYNTFSEEVRSGDIPFTTYYNNLMGGTENAVFGMYCDVFYGANSYTINFQISRDYKKTVNLFLSFIEKQSKADAKKLIAELKGENSDMVEIDFGNALGYDRNFIGGKENDLKLAKILQNAKTEGITAEDKTIMLKFYKYNLKDYVYTEGTDEEYIAVFALNDKQIKELEALTEDTTLYY